MTGRIHYLQIYFKHFAHFDKRYVSFELKNGILHSKIYENHIKSQCANNLLYQSNMLYHDSVISFLSQSRQL